MHVDGEIMKTVAKSLRRQIDAKNTPAARSSPDRSKGPSHRERVLIEFPVRLLQQTDAAARALNRNRSELIRSAVERFLNDMEAKKFEEQLAAAYAANSKMNRDICHEFAAVDREGF